MTAPAGSMRFAILLGAVALAALALRVFFVVAAAEPPPDPGDAVAYHLLGEGIAEGDGYVRPFDRIEGRSIATAEWAPALPVLLAAGELIGIRTIDGQRMIGAVVGAATVVLTGAAGARIGGRKAGFAAAAAMALHPLLVLHDTAVLSEGLAMLAASVTLLVTIAYIDRPTARRAALVGAAVGGAALVRADALALVPSMVVPAIVVAERRAGRAWNAVARTGAVAVGCTVAVLVPWTARNVIRLDAVVPVSTNAATAIAGANCEATFVGDVVGYWRFGDECFDGYDTRALVAHGEATVAREHMQEGTDYALDHLGQLPVVVGARVLRLWGAWDLDQQVFLTALDERKPESWVRAGTVAGWLVVVLAIAGAARLVRRHDRTTLVALVGPALAVTAAAAVTYGNARFRAGAEPALAVLAALALTGRSSG